MKKQGKAPVNLITSIFAGLLFTCGVADASPLDLFKQTFSSSTNLLDFVASTPDSNQFDSITAGSGDTFSIVRGALQLSKGAAVASTINRTTALETSPLTFFCCQMDVHFSFADQTAGKSLGFVELYDDGPTAPWGAAVAFSVATGTDHLWKVTGGAGSFFGVQTVRAYVNNTGVDKAYADPCGAVRILNNTFVDVWVGTNLVRSSVAMNLNATNDINGFRIVSPANGVDTGTFTYDNFFIQKIPEQTLFSQDFSSSTNVAGYVSVTPGTNKFNGITVGVGDAFSITNGALQLTKGSAVNSTINRTTALGAAPLTLFSFQFDIGFTFIASNQAANASLGFFELGNGTGSVIWGTCGFQLDSSYKDNKWKVAGGEGSFTNVQTVKVYCNNTGSATTYIDPQRAHRPILNDCIDIWVGNTLAKSKVANATNDVTGFRFVSPANGITSGTITCDNMLIKAIPPAVVKAAGELILSNDFSISSLQAMPCAETQSGQFFEKIDYVEQDAIEWQVLLQAPESGESPLFEDVKSADFIVQFPVTNPVTLHWSRGSHSNITDFQPLEELLYNGSPFVLESFGGRSSDGAMPYFNLAGDGGGLIIAVGWPGDWRTVLESLGEGKVRITAGLKRSYFRLNLGEEVRLPSILVMSYSGDWIAGQNKFRQLMLEQFTPKTHDPMDLMPVAVTAGNAFNHNETSLVARATNYGAVDLPLDTFWVDAGWNEGGFPLGIGNPGADPVRFPNGMGPVGDAVNDSGKRFLLWFEPERAMTNTWLASAHPEWLLSPSGTPAELRYMESAGFRLLDLGNTNALAWALDVVSQDLLEADVEIYRQDFNEYPSYFWHTGELPEEIGLREVRHINGLYVFLDGLTNRCPGLIIDNCASGGRRLDFEMMRRSVPLWRSDSCWDDSTYPRNVQAMTHGLSLWLPLHGLGSKSTTDVNFRSGMGAFSTFPINIANAVPREALRKHLERYLPVRRLFATDYYPLTDWSDDPSQWLAFQFNDSAEDEGIVQAFCGAAPSNRTYSAKLFGLDPAESYVVTDWDHTATPVKYSGEQLISQGIEIHAGTNESAFVFQYVSEKKSRVYFSQNFSSSTNVADYTSASPGTNKFNSITTGVGDAFSITGGALQLTKGGAVASTINRTTPLAISPLTLFRFQFDVGFAFTGQAASTSLGYFEFGKGTGTSNWGTFSFLTDSSGADNTWKVSDGLGGFTGVQTVTVYVNDTGSTAIYINPLGVRRTLTNTFADIWVGNTLARSKVIQNVNTTNDMNGFRFVSPANGIASGTLTVDNFLIESVLPPSSYERWAITSGLSIGVNDHPYDNPDGDRLNNLSEYSLGGNPTDSLDQGIAPASFLAKSGGTNWFIYTYPERSGPNSGLSYRLETSTNLMNVLSWTNAQYEVVGSVVSNSDFDCVTRRILIDDAPARFIRLMIEKQ